jgi:3',5'-cyclic AMP phosphodiesterase CpdA
MTEIIVLTDLHMVPEGDHIIGLDPYERLKKGIAHINRHHPNAHRVIVTGDLCHRGDLPSYERLKSVLDTLDCRYELLIGNHDRRDHFIQVFPDQSRDANGFVQRRLVVPGGVLLLLDTLYAPPYEFPKSYSGLLCKQRMEWLAQQLQESHGQTVYIFMHHPPHPTGFAGMDAIALSNGDAFYALLARFPNVRHIVAGHVHRTINGSHKGIGFSVFKSTCHQQPLVFSAEDTSLSVDEPAAYGLLVLQQDGVLVHTEDYEISGLNATIGPDLSVLGH